MRYLTAAVACGFLGICVLFGAAAAFFVPVHLPLWAAVAVAASVGLAAGGLAPRALASWLAWPSLVIFVWIAYGWAAGAGLLGARTPVDVVYPLAASAGVAAGLGAWRLPAWRLRLLPVAGCLAAVAGLVIFAGPLARRGAPAPDSALPTGYRAPAFDLPLLDGGRLRSASLSGKTVVLAFWASWCDPCREELPRLERLFRRNRDDPRLAFYLVDIGGAGETPAGARAFLAKYGISVPSAYDPDGTVAMQFRIDGALPARVVIGPRGIVRYASIGYAPGRGELAALRKAAEKAGEDAAR